MAAASNAAAELAAWKAELQETQQTAGQGRSANPVDLWRPGQPMADQVIRHAGPPKPFKEMTGAEFLAWDDRFGFAKAMTPPPRYPNRPR